MSETITSIDLIQAIGSLWKLVVAVGFLVAIIIFREPLKKSIAGLKNLRIKKGQTELAFDQIAEKESKKLDEIPSSEAKQEPEKKDSAKDIVEPKEATEWFSEMVRAFRENRVEDAEEAFKKLQTSEANAIDRIKNEAIYLWFKYTKGIDENALQRLEELTDNDDARGNVLFWLANCHEFVLNYDKAIEAHQRALSAKISDKERADHIVSISQCMSKMDKTDDGIAFIISNLNNVESEEAKAALYKGLADLHEKSGNIVLRAIALQKVLQYKPEDRGSLFDAAYTQSAAEFSQLCTTNYHTLLKFNPDNYSALNNLGVECESLEMPIKSVQYYKRAIEKDNTLAMANLSYRYMNQGFEQEARDILDKAKSKDKPHRNVGEAIANLEDRKESESKKWDEVMNQGIKQQHFFWDYAEAYFEPIEGDPIFTGEWVSDKGKIYILEQNGKEITAKWETEDKGEKITGSICNLSAEIKYQEKKRSLGWLEPYWGTSRKGYGYFSKDRKRFYLHIHEKEHFLFFSMNKKESLENNKAENSYTQQMGGGDAC